MARRAIGVIDAPADSARIEPGLAMWGALVEVPPAHEDVGWRPSPKLGAVSLKKEDEIRGRLTAGR